MIIALTVMAWLAVGPLLSWFMGSRGHDRTSWWLVGMLFGPVAILLAAVNLPDGLLRNLRS